MWDLIVVGAGPVGLEAAILAKKADLNVLILEKGTLVNTIFGWPNETTFFSEAKNIEIGGHPFPSLAPKPTRREALQYYRRVAEIEALNIRTYVEVLELNKNLGNWDVTAKVRGEKIVFKSKNVLIATGYFDNPNKLGVPGEELPHVAFGMTETLKYWNQDVAIIGGSNSAVETALDLYRAGARVTVIHHDAEIRPRVKYWLKPDFDNRVAEGSIRLELNANVVAVRANVLEIQRIGESPITKIPADFVLVHVGYHAVDTLLKGAKVQYSGDAPVLSSDFESSAKGLFVAGSAGFGSDTRTVFIENGREHARKAVQEIVYRSQKCN